MAPATDTHTEFTIEAAGGKVHVLKGGSGKRLLILHHDIGNPGWIPLYDELARNFTVFVPSHPGFGKSDRPEWMRNVRDMAIVYQSILRELKLGSVAAVGLGFGGWIAAELATMCPHRFDHLVLVNAMGMQPRKGEIFDQFIVNTIEYITAGFADSSKFTAQWGEKPEVDQMVQWEVNREMTTRIAWKPYMFNQAMPHLARTITTPTMIVWGERDPIVPFDCAMRYHEAIAGAKLEVVTGAAHFVDMEQPSTLAQLVREFAG